MRVYRCRVCGAVKTKKGIYFEVVVNENGFEPGKVRFLLHLIAAHHDYSSELDYDIVDTETQGGY